MAIQMGFGPGDFDAKTWRSVAAEFIATGLFVFIGTSTVVVVAATVNDFGGALVAISLAHGIAFAVFVAAVARISGGHLNPAVTFAAALTGNIKISTAILYIAGQLAAAVLAVLLLKGIVAGPMEGALGAHGLSVFDPNGAGGLLDNQFGDGAGAGLLLEGVLTFALVFVVFATAIDPKGPSSFAPIAMGLTVMIGQFSGLAMTGASMNPARSFGPAIAANVWTDHWVYWLGPLIGAALAAIIYQNVFLEPDEEDSAIEDTA